MEKVTPEDDFPGRLLHQVSSLLVVLGILPFNDVLPSKCFMIDEIHNILFYRLDHNSSSASALNYEKKCTLTMKLL
jgi:hypothetical protein